MKEFELCYHERATLRKEIEFDGEQIRVFGQRQFAVRRYEVKKNLEDCEILDIDLHLCPDMDESYNPPRPDSDKTFVLNIGISDIGRIRLNVKEINYLP